MLSVDGDRGASALLVALAMLLLLGVLAVALDISAAFNERNQNQNAGDNGVMSGALEKAVDAPSDEMIVTRALEIVQANLTADFPGGMTDPDWITAWRSCSDDGNPGWIPLPEPLAWGGAGTLDCISQTTSLLRIRVPDQLVATSFGRALGSETLATTALSIAKVGLTVTAPPVVPFGIEAGTGAGEFCLSSASSGTAYLPCTGSQTGSFGPIISPLFADFGNHSPECSGNTLRWFERNMVWGLDHRIKEWPPAGTVPIPSSWPGEAGLDLVGDANRDACNLDPDGNPTPINGIPINTVRVDTGFPDPAMTNALVSDMFFDGRPARLQQPTTATRQAKSGSTIWDLDNVGPWAFLTETSGVLECRGSSYAGMTTDQKTSQFEACIANPGAGEIFDADTITTSPRFVWAPEYTYDSPPGSHFNPVRRFRPVFLAGVWFNCPNPNSGQPCGSVFFPDQDVTTQICHSPPASCKQLRVDQVSAWLLPDTSLPQSVFDDFDAAFVNLEPELFQ